MIARTKEKLEKAASEVMAKYGVQTKAIVADFSSCATNPPEFFGNITDQLKGLPISILVNNVGTGVRKNLSSLTTDEVINMNSLNLWPIIYLSHFLVN